MLYKATRILESLTIFNAVSIITVDITVKFYAVNSSKSSSQTQNLCLNPAGLSVNGDEFLNLHGVLDVNVRHYRPADGS